MNETVKVREITKLENNLKYVCTYEKLSNVTYLTVFKIVENTKCNYIQILNLKIIGYIKEEDFKIYSKWHSIFSDVTYSDMESESKDFLEDFNYKVDWTFKG